MATRFSVTFGEHLSPDQVASFISQLAAYGLLADAPEPHDVAVDVRRVPNLKGLSGQLTIWDQWGSLRWSEEQISK
jgi:hypothetical protein